MTTDELLAELERRGIKVAMRADGRPILQGETSKASPILLRVLMDWHREAICRKLFGRDPAPLPKESEGQPTPPDAAEARPEATEAVPAIEPAAAEEDEPETEWKPAPAGWPDPADEGPLVLCRLVGGDGLTVEVWSDELARINAAMLCQKQRRESRDGRQKDGIANASGPVASAAGGAKPDTQLRLF